MGPVTFWDKLSVRERKIFYVTLVLLVAIFGYHAVWRPLSGKLMSMDEEIFALQLRLRKATIYIRQRDQVMEEAKKYPNLEQMTAGTDEEEIARLLNMVEQTARNVGVSLSDVKPEQLTSDKIAKRFIVELSAECELNQLVDFIYRLEHSPQQLKFEKVEIAPKGDKTTTVRSSMIVTRVVVK